MQKQERVVQSSGKPSGRDPRVPDYRNYLLQNRRPTSHPSQKIIIESTRHSRKQISRLFSSRSDAATSRPCSSVCRVDIPPSRTLHVDTQSQEPQKRLSPNRNWSLPYTRKPLECYGLANLNRRTKINPSVPHNLEFSSITLLIISNHQYALDSKNHFIFSLTAVTSDPIT